MSILNRSELSKLITDQEIIIGDKVAQDAKNDYSAESSIQPCSVYLHVGEIYLPEQRKNKRGSETNPIKGPYSLEPGEVILVRTDEKLSIPSNIGGICFAPAQYSLKGLLIVNIGHIDPGYHGKLHYTVVNLGKENFIIEKNSPISKLLLFQLSADTCPRGSEKFIKVKDVDIPEIVHNSLPRLSKSFMNINDKTEKRIQSKFSRYSILIPLLSAIVTAVIAFVIPLSFNRFSEISELQTKNGINEIRIENLKEDYEIQIKNMKEDYDKDIEELSEKISELEELIEQD